MAGMDTITSQDILHQYDETRSTATTITQDDVLPEIRRLAQSLHRQLDKAQSEEAVQKRGSNSTAELTEICTHHSKDDDNDFGQLHHLTSFEESISKELGEFSELLEGSPKKDKETKTIGGLQRLDEYHAKRLNLDDETMESFAGSELETVTDLHDIWISSPQGHDPTRIIQQQTAAEAKEDSVALQETLLLHTKRVVGLLQNFANQLDSADDLDSVKSNVQANLLSEVQNLAHLQASLDRRSSVKSQAGTGMPYSTEPNLMLQQEHQVSPIQPVKNTSNIFRPKPWEKTDISISDDTTVSAITVNSHQITSHRVERLGGLTSFGEYQVEDWNQTSPATTTTVNNTHASIYKPTEASSNHNYDPYYDPAWQTRHENQYRPTSTSNDDACWGLTNGNTSSEFCLPALQSLLGVVRKVEGYFQYFIEKRESLIAEPHQETELSQFRYYDRSAVLTTL